MDGCGLGNLTLLFRILIAPSWTVYIITCPARDNVHGDFNRLIIMAFYLVRDLFRMNVIRALGDSCSS